MAAASDPPKNAPVPERPVPRIAPAEFERDAAKHKAEQHGDDQRIGCRQQHRIGQREGGEQPAAAQHQPGFVPVPYRRDGVHRAVALHPHLDRRKQYADAQVEPVHHHIGKDGKGDDKRPDDGQVDGNGHQSRSSSRGGVSPASAGRSCCARPGVMPAVRMGPSSPRCSAGSWLCGVVDIRRNMYQTPTPNTAK